MTTVTSDLPLRPSLEVVSQHTGDTSVLQIQLYQFHYLQLLGFGMWFGKGEGFEEVEVENCWRTLG